MKGPDGTRSRPDLRERTHTRETPQDIEAEQAKVFKNVSLWSSVSQLGDAYCAAESTPLAKFSALFND